MVILDYDLLKGSGKFSTPMISSKTMTKTLYGNVEKMFSQMRKKWLSLLGFKKESSGTSRSKVFESSK